MNVNLLNIYQKPILFRKNNNNFSKYNNVHFSGRKKSIDNVMDYPQIYQKIDLDNRNRHIQEDGKLIQSRSEEILENSFKVCKKALSAQRVGRSVHHKTAGIEQEVKSRLSKLHLYQSEKNEGINDGYIFKLTKTSPDYYIYEEYQEDGKLKRRVQYNPKGLELKTIEEYEDNGTFNKITFNKRYNTVELNCSEDENGNSRIKNRFQFHLGRLYSFSKDITIDSNNCETSQENIDFTPEGKIDKYQQDNIFYPDGSIHSNFTYIFNKDYDLDKYYEDISSNRDEIVAKRKFDYKNGKIYSYYKDLTEKNNAPTSHSLLFEFEDGLTSYVEKEHIITTQQGEEKYKESYTFENGKLSKINTELCLN